MKRTIFILPFLMLLWWSAGAQEVEKQVEVRKTYTPKVEHAEKLAILPNMRDTTRLHPEIDYTITPLSLSTQFAVEPIRPASVTYWEFNRPHTSYIKAGAGYPLNSVVDVYASTQNSGTGYVVGYLNHEGQFQKLKNDFGIKNRSRTMLNRAGVAAGKYLGRYVLEGDLRFENRLHDRYGMYADDQELAAGSEYAAMPGSMASFSTMDLMLRFGDDFQDLNRTNIELTVRGGGFFDHSEWIAPMGKAREMTLNADFRIARKLRQHTLRFDAGYELLRGFKSISDHREQTFRAALHYGTIRPMWQIESGAEFFYTDIRHGKNDWFLLPYVRATWDFGMQHLVPFVEVDGTLHNNDYRTLSEVNPYLTPNSWDEGKSVDYNLRAGFSGSLWHNKISYRIYGGASSLKDHLTWYGVHTGTPADPMRGALIALEPARHDITELSFNSELLLRPISALSFNIAFHAYHYDNDSIFGIGLPAFRGRFAAKYDHPKFTIDLSADLESERWWTMLYNGGIDMEDGTIIDENREQGAKYEAPLAVDVSVAFRWKLNAKTGLFIEGFNLANADLYRQPWYRLRGAGFTAGIKMQF